MSQRKPVTINFMAECVIEWCESTITFVPSSFNGATLREFATELVFTYEPFYSQPEGQEPYATDGEIIAYLDKYLTVA